MNRPNIVWTGIPSLDLLLRSGMPARQTLLVTGEPGTGKTIFGSQIAFAYAKQGRRAVVASVASESHDKLLDELQGFAFFDPDEIGDRFFVLSAYPALKRGAKDAKDLFLRTMRERKADLLFIDGLRTLRDLWQNEAQLRDFLHELGVGVAQLGATTLLTAAYSLEDAMKHPEAMTVDGIIALSLKSVNGHVVRRVRVVKLRGRNHLAGEHAMHIADDGIRIVPRLEEIAAPMPNAAPTLERFAFGLPDLDRALCGGLPKGSATLLLGSTGVGKTLLALHLAARAAWRDRALMLSYVEPAERLMARACAVSLDVRELVSREQLVLAHRTPLNAEADDLVADLLVRVRRTGAMLVVVVDLRAIENATCEDGRTKALLMALLIELRNLGVTALFVQDFAASASMTLEDTAIGAAVDNVLVCRNAFVRGRTRRVVSVTKMRASSHDPRELEIVIGNDGIRVIDPADPDEYTGITHIAPAPTEPPH
jgi:circadian clock protein KaiC